MANSLCQEQGKRTMRETEVQIGNSESLVTGGTSGIGLAAANALAKEGAHVYITGRREPELRTAVQQIGRNATGVRGDVSKAHDLDRLFTQIKDEKGKLDLTTKENSHERAY